MNVMQREQHVRGIDRKAIGEELRKKLGLEPLNAPVLVEVARSALQKGATAEALRIYVGLVLCDPCDIELQMGLAHCALLINQNELAVQAASVVIALAPTDPRGYLLSGLACLALRHIKEAKEDLTQAIEFARRANLTPIVTDAVKLLTELATWAA